MNVNLPPIVSCCSGVPCATSKKCYAIKAYRQYPNVRKSWDNNLEIYNHYNDFYFDNISIQIKSKKKIKRFRWHSSGDIIDQKYLNGMKHIANEFPNINFLAYTKNNFLDFNNLPKNLKIRFSMWPSFNNATSLITHAWLDDGTEHRIPTLVFKCLNSCAKCAYCWTGKKDVVFKIH